MDIIEILIPLLATLAYLYFMGKKKRQGNDPSVPPVYEYGEEEESIPWEEEIPMRSFEENVTIPSKKATFVNYDEMNPEQWKAEEILRKEREEYAYLLDNEKENEIEIATDIESFRRGVIYAEILKSPYKQSFI